MKTPANLLGCLVGFVIGLLISVLIVVALEYYLARSADADEWKVNGRTKHGHCDVVTGRRLLIVCENERELCIFTVNEMDERESGWQCADNEDEV